MALTGKKLECGEMVSFFVSFTLSLKSNLFCFSGQRVGLLDLDWLFCKEESSYFLRDMHAWVVRIGIGGSFETNTL